MNYFLLFALVVVTLNLSLVTSTVDPASRLCASVCRRENAQTRQCIVENACASNSSCRKQCEVAENACQGLCRENFDSVYRVCFQQCSWNGLCAEDCFYDKMTIFKIEQLGCTN